jgi:hypothetical protein
VHIFAQKNRCTKHQFSGHIIQQGEGQENFVVVIAVFVIVVYYIL